MARCLPRPHRQFGFPDATALGLREPVERTLQTRAQTPFAGLLSALEEDANALAGTFGVDQARQLGNAVKRTPLTEPMWNTEPEFKEWARDELKRARQMAEFGDLVRLGEEAHDFRPDF